MPLYRTIRVSLSFAALILFSGCWDSIEIEDLALVIGTGFDKLEDGRIEATVQIASPSGASDVTGDSTTHQKPYLVLSETGTSGAQLIERMQKQLASRFSLGHRTIVVYGESFAREGLDQALDQILRAPDSRYTAYVLTANGITAKEVLNAPYMLENIPAIAIKDMQQFKGVYGVRVDEMVRAFVDDEVAMITGVVEKIKDPEEDSKIRVNGGAVYKQNKLVGFMNEDMIRMLLWRRGELRETMLTTQVQPKSKMYSGDVGIMMLRGNSRIKSKIVDGKPHFTIYFKGVAKIIENNTNLDMGDERNLEKTAEKFTQKFEKLMDELLHAAKNEWHVDILDLGKELHIHHTKYWQEHKAEWDELFPSVEVDYKFELTISRTGRMKSLQLS